MLRLNNLNGLPLIVLKSKPLSASRSFVDKNSADSYAQDQQVLCFKHSKARILIIHRHKLKNKRVTTYTKAFPIPEYDRSPSALCMACRRVLTTSNGFTDRAAKEPATHPDKNEHQNTASPKAKKKCVPDPSLLLGPKSLRVANSGKYITENETSRSIVAPVPLYKPKIPCCLNKPMASSVAEVQWKDACDANDASNSAIDNFWNQS
ncbi:hypothetical protein HUJ05_003530 [Dendroctonus ponderosae]|nr:hypothetical protein HUJ05_003530 [Dendroctonus ponderosae]